MFPVEKVLQEFQDDLLELFQAIYHGPAAHGHTFIDGYVDRPNLRSVPGLELTDHHPCWP